MTTPTQAQIEAAKIIKRLRQEAQGLRDDRVENGVYEKDNAELMEDAAKMIAALTAAAEVDPALRDSAMARVAALIEPLHEAITDYAKARNNLIAAAGVGGQKPDQIQIDKAMTEYERGIESATIERCAQVAKAAAAKALEDHQRCKDSKDAAVDHYLWCHDEAVAIEAAIRALKDKL